MEMRTNRMEVAGNGMGIGILIAFPLISTVGLLYSEIAASGQFLNGTLALGSYLVTSTEIRVNATYTSHAVDDETEHEHRHETHRD